MAAGDTNVCLGSNTNNPANYARLYRYSYEGVMHTYTLDAGFPVNLNHDKTASLVLAKDSTGRLWITYVSRNVQADPSFYKVYVNATTAPNNDTSWGTPIALPDLQNPGAFAVEGRTGVDDIAAIVAFRDNGGNKVGILWSTAVTPTAQISGTNHINFAWHLDSKQSYNKGADWALQAGLNLLANTNPSSNANNHLNIKALRTATSGQVFAAIKFDNQFLAPPQPTFPEIGLLARDVDGTFVYRKYSTVADNDSRPLLLLDEGDTANPNDTSADVFVSGQPQGSKICYKALKIPTGSLTALGQFPAGNCGTAFILDASGVYTTFRDPTSTKQNVNTTTGMVVLASDVNGRVYAHNAVGNPPPVVTAVGPTGAAVGLTSVVTATFSKPISATTLNNSTFLVFDGVTPVAGTLSYNSTTRTAIFTPSSPLKATTPYTVKLTNGIKDTTGLALEGFKAPSPNTVVEQWRFTTGVTTVQFAFPTYSVVENGGLATISVTLAAPASQPVTVTYATSDGTATAGQDYTATTGTMLFAPGDTVKTFGVPIVDDNVTEGNETVKLALSNPVGASAGIPMTASLTIIDNEGPVAVQFAPISYVVNENTPSGQAVLTVILSHPSTTTVTVGYTTSDGTATAGQDYTAASGTLTFVPGETSKIIAIPITNDNVVETDETVHVGLQSPTGGAVLGSPDEQALLTIKDTTGVLTVQFETASYTVAEAGGAAQITVKLNTPSAFTVTVAYATSDGTATTGQDYMATSGTLTFAPGETIKTFAIPILDDALSEANETVNLTLRNASSALLGNPAQTTLTIQDDDAVPPVQFSVANDTVAENGGKATLTVQLSAPAGRPVEVHYSSSDGTATANSDYRSVDDTLLIAPGQTSATFDVVILNDTLAEPNETLTLTLDTPVNASLGAVPQATLTILDDDTPVVTGSRLYLPLIRR